LVGRVGGDEFALFLVTGTAQAAGRVAQKVLSVLGEPYSIDGHQVPATASIGVASDAAHAMSVEGLVEQADQAMYRAKAAGGNGYSFDGIAAAGGGYRKIPRRALISSEQDGDVESASGAQECRDV
jgi:predicted signal transduction protein with EAL and GGDEF domain